ncbi:sucrase ferredoxin [Nocardioides solisilvae]|uniref:sucrase ferredoxin n=1 Tax=Nocardioides solisilvae TaxID=1542435 RepID=UPI000D74E653|nr:sucrase ferredoxin [Nocardioides solisilvae]
MSTALPDQSHDPTFRCSGASRADGEALAGTAPTERAFLLVEHAGAWGRQAVADSRLPAPVKQRLADLAGVRVMLVRRHGGISGPGVRVFTVLVEPDRVSIETTVLDDPEQLLDLDTAALAEGRSPGLTPYDGGLLLVCTNGRRDLCCAELGRPVTAALAARWPEETWETTHLGGHRFSATLVDLPSGVTLGRLDPESAVLAVEELRAGRHPVGFSRGRVGVGVAAQVAQLHVVEATGLDGLGDVVVVGEEDGVVRLTVDGAPWQVGVVARAGEPRRQSCADLSVKATTVHEVVASGPTM